MRQAEPWREGPAGGGKQGGGNGEPQTSLPPLGAGQLWGFLVARHRKDYGAMLLTSNSKLKGDFIAKYMDISPTEF